MSRDKLLDELRVKAASWQEQCDGWIAAAKKLGDVDPGTETIMRRCLYAEAADALASTQEDILRLRNALEPFAKVYVPANWSDDEITLDEGLTAGHFRLAARSLHNGEGK